MHNVYRRGLTATFILLISIFIVGCTSEESSQCFSNLDDCQSENYDLTEKVEELEAKVDQLEGELRELNDYVESECYEYDY